MAVFVSLVGKQPAAVAVPLASWARKNLIPTVVLLLATRQAESEAERLKKWSERVWNAQSKILPISGGMEKEDDRDHPDAVVKQWLQKNSAAKAPIIFNAGPGLNFQVAGIARALPEGSRLLHPMADALSSRLWERNREFWQHWPLADIGLNDLLQLCEIRRLPDQPSQCASELMRSLKKARVSLLPTLVTGLKVQGKESAEPVTFDLAFESKGQLHALRVLEGEGDAILQVVREVQRLHVELPGLWLRIAVWTSNRAAAGRLRRSGHLTLTSPENLISWVMQTVPKPGHPAAGPAPEAIPPSPIDVLTEVHHGRGGAGPGLAVCLGNDPSATLVSLATHKPSKAWVVYDATTPIVVETARRLADQARYLPIGTLQFVPSDVLGCNVRGQLKKLSADQPIRVDVSPGTKAQACALALVANSEVWSLGVHTGYALRLGNHGCIPLDGPPLVSLAISRGGEILHPGMVPERQEGQFYSSLAKFLAQEAKVDGSALRGDLFDRGEDISRTWGAILFQQKAGTQRVSVRFQDQQASLPEVPKGGQWFECLVGSAFRSAGAEEVRCQIKWRWPKEQMEAIKRTHKEKGIEARQPLFMDEVDVLARFGHHVVAVSCKAGENVSWQKAKREIEAVARVTTGRFCLPVLARTRLNEEQREARKTTRQGAIFIDLQDLANPEDLRAVIDDAFTVRSTLAN